MKKDNQIFPWVNFEKNRTLRKMGAMPSDTIRERPEWFNKDFEEEHVTESDKEEQSPELERHNYYDPIYQAAVKIDKNITREDVYNWLNDFMDEDDNRRGIEK